MKNGLCTSAKPNKEQAILINKTMGCSRFVFNHFLAKWNDTYKTTGKGLTYRACSSQLPSLNKEYEWLKEVDSIAIQSSIKNLADAYARFLSNKTKPHVLNLKRITYSPIQQNISTEILPL
jgi:putative transposase